MPRICSPRTSSVVFQLPQPLLKSWDTAVPFLPWNSHCVRKEPLSFCPTLIRILRSCLGSYISSVRRMFASYSPIQPLSSSPENACILTTPLYEALRMSLSIVPLAGLNSNFFTAPSSRSLLLQITNSRGSILNGFRSEFSRKISKVSFMKSLTSFYVILKLTKIELILSFVEPSKSIRFSDIILRDSDIFPVSNPPTPISSSALKATSQALWA